MREPVDKFNDHLIDGIEKQGCKCRQLPLIELRRFRGNPSEWPEFISSFRRKIHEKVSFENNMRMERFLSASR